MTRQWWYVIRRGEVRFIPSTEIRHDESRYAKPKDAIAALERERAEKKSKREQEKDRIRRKREYGEWQATKNPFQ